MIQHRKQVKTFTELLESYSSSCTRALEKYENQLSNFTNQSVQTLSHLFQSYLLNKRSITHHSQCQSNEGESNFAPKTADETRKLQNYQRTDGGMKNNCKVIRCQDQTIILSEKMKKMGLDCDFMMDEDERDMEMKEENEEYSVKKSLKKKSKNKSKHLLLNQFESDDCQQEQSQVNNEHTTNLLEIENLKHRNLSDIIKQSNKKMLQKMQKKQLLPPCPQHLPEEQSQYDMTDYSSNQSSNEGSYEAHYGDENENKPLFGLLFSKAISSDSSCSSLNFTTKQLLKSPKKVNKTKRLFVGHKKIPRWAEDLQRISKNQQLSMEEPTKIFGTCVVENLNTNVIFKEHLENSRTSSAKWNPKMFLD